MLEYNTMANTRYQYTLAEDYIYYSDFSDLFAKTEKDKFEMEFGIIFRDRIQIKEGYSWNGCSGYVWQGKRIEREKWMPVVTAGSDEYTQTIPASVVHDFMYQYLYQLKRESNLSNRKVRKVADKKFYRILKKVNFKYAKLYYNGLRVFGVSTYIKKLFAK